MVLSARVVFMGWSHAHTSDNQVLFNVNGFCFYPLSLVLQFPDNSKEGFGCQCTWFLEPASCRPVSGFTLVVGFQPKLSAFKKKKVREEHFNMPGVSATATAWIRTPWDSCYHQRQDHSGDPVTWLPLGLWILCIPQLACTCGDLGADWQPWGCRAWPCLWLVRGWARRQPTFPPCSWLAWTRWWQIRSWCKLSRQMSTPIPPCVKRLPPLACRGLTCHPMMTSTFLFCVW